MDATYKGYNGVITLTDNCVILKGNWRAAIFGKGLTGEKTIPYKSISGVQFKKAGLFAGYLQIVVHGVESKSGLFGSRKDENSVNFHMGSNKKFEEAYRTIVSKIQ